MTPLYFRPGLINPGEVAGESSGPEVLWRNRLARATSVPFPRTLEAFWDLLTGWAALQRLRPELLQEWAVAPSLDHATTLARQLGPEAFVRIQEQFSLEGWMAAAARLGDAVDLETEAIRLLSQLDDWELVEWATAQFGGPKPVASSSKSCFEWIENHPALFLPAALYILDVGRLLRPDLPFFDFDLAMTADKFVLLLDLLEEVESDEGWIVSPLFKVIEEARQRVRQTRAPSWLPPLQAVPLAAAQTLGPTHTLKAMRWRSPDGRYSAYLVLPTPSVPMEESQLVRLNIFEGDEPALGHTQSRAWLAGVSAPIDAQGGADFPMAHLRLAEHQGIPPVLLLGQDPTPWVRDQDL